MLHYISSHLRKKIQWVVLLAILASIFSQALLPSFGMDQETSPPILIGDDINYPPYSYLDEDGNPTGFNVELAKAIGRVMDLPVEIRLDEWTVIREALENGEIHGISGMFRSPEREEIYAFTTYHSITSGDLFTRRGFQVDSLEEIRGATIVVQEADIVAEYLSLQEDLDFNLVHVQNVREVMELVADGTYDYAAVLKLPGLYNIQAYDMNHLVPQGLSLTTNQYAMALMPENRELLLLLNAGMEILSATGEYQELYEEWLGVYEEPSVVNLLYRYGWILGSVLVLISLLVASVLTLRLMVRRKTNELHSVNTEMEAAMEELVAMDQELRDQLDSLRLQEEQLRTSEEKSRAIINALPDILFVFDQAGHLLDCQSNPEHELLFPVSQFVGKHLKEVIPAPLADKTLDHIQKAAEKGSLQQFEYELILQEERKVFELRLVPSTNQEVIGLSRDITQEKLHLEKIEFLSYHDQLTGLYNRRFLEEAVQRLDHPSNYPLCVIMADVNGLKLINDSFGQQVGDQLLKTAASLLKDACPGDEIVGRIGGDEFLILLPRMSHEAAETLVKKIRDQGRQTQVETVEVSISFGWDTKTDETQEMQKIFQNAENYMYQKKLFERPSMRSKTVHAIMNTLHEKNPREEKHSQRVSDLCVQIAQAMEFSDRGVNEMKSIGLLHDIGKISIDEGILNKPGKLSEAEYLEIKRHPEIGYRILSAVNDMQDTADYVLSHHERWDGTGYPQGLQGEEIPLQSRIITIADAYDAMVGQRSYRPSRSSEEAAMELLAHAGTQFDPDLTAIFVKDVLKMDF